MTAPITAPINTLDLDGWSHRSIWGWDAQARSYYAQLWHDHDRRDAPTIWVDGTGRRIPTVEALSVQIAARIGLPAIMVRDGMAEAIAAQHQRTALVPGGWFLTSGPVIVRVLSRVEADHDPDERDLYRQGWVLGFHYSDRTGSTYDTGHVALTDVAGWCPITVGEAYEWLRFWCIEWAAVQRMDRVIAG
ncbi:MAG TPA: hypothetical protein VFC16_08405 [Nakamurella sp.]|nr:hypothetical protein [Nakamurella sp.]